MTLNFKKNKVYVNKLITLRKMAQLRNKITLQIFKLSNLRFVSIKHLN